MRKYVNAGKRFFAMAFFLFLAATANTQSICGGIVEDFNNTAGSTAGFTGDLSLAVSGANGFLQKNRVVASGLYTITTPTYQLPVVASFVGFGFLLQGAEQIARVEAAIMYISTLNGQMTTIFLSQFIPSYDPGSAEGTVCRAIALNELPGFPVGGQYRFRFELTPNTGTGLANQTITFDDFRTNGTLAQSPLPVTFVSVDARHAGGNAVHLAWKVAGEENVRHYEIERSANGRNFLRIGQVAPQGKPSYSFTDAANNSEVFYRIKNVDRNGQAAYSLVARVALPKKGLSLSVYPQPAASQLTLTHPMATGNTFVTLHSADGKLLQSIRPAEGSQQTSVETGSLQKGLYLLRFASGDDWVETVKFTRQ